MRLTLFHSAQAQEQGESTTEVPAVPAPPAPDAATTELDAGERAPGAESSGWSAADGWWAVILALVAILVLAIAIRRRRGR